MSKLGDLIVRLKLKYEDYSKGLKSAEKETKKFESSFQKIKGAGIAVWAAIGAGAIKLGKDLVSATNQAEDAWAMFTTKAKAGWNTFIKTLLNGEWDKFIQKFKEEVAAAEILQEALDADTEIANSIALKKSYYAEELAKLEVLARDTTKSDNERLAAAERYKKIIKEIYDQELDRAQLLRKAHYQSFMPGKDEAVFTDEMMAMLDRALILYGETKKKFTVGQQQFTFAEAVAKAYVNSQEDLLSSKVEDLNLYGSSLDLTDAEVQDYALQRLLSGKLNQYVKSIMSELGIELGNIPVESVLKDFFKGYEANKNGQEVQSLIATIIDTDKAKAAYDEITKKMQILTAQLGGKISNANAELIDIATPLAKVFEPFAMVEPITPPDIIPDDWLTRNREKIDEALAEAERLQGITNEINQNFNEAVVSSLSGATQALVDCIAGIEGADASQVLAALMQPFANTMMQLGEVLLAEGLAISAFKESLKSLNPSVAIAAGATLLALGAALSSGIRSLGGASSSTSESASSSSSSGVETYEQEITVHVVGEISGDKIVLVGDKTLNKWRR